MTQSAQTGATTPSASAGHLPGKASAAAKLASAAWVAVSAQLGMLRDHPALLQPTLAPLALPPVLGALAALVAQHVELQWAPVFFTLLSSLLALTGIGALPSGGRIDGVTGWLDAWRSPRAGADASATARDRFATRLGSALVALAVLSALPLAIPSAHVAKLLIGLGLAEIALYTLDAVRRRIAPLDEVIAAMCLGPGLVALTIAAQGQQMSGLYWLIAEAFGCMALVVIEGRRLRAADAASDLERRTLLSVVGKRSALGITGLALAGSFALAVVISVGKTGLPGALLALSALPLSLVGLSGVAISYYLPARRVAATQLARAYMWFGLALATGIALTVIMQGFTRSIVRLFGG